jgi:hypothetical protein
MVSVTDPYGSILGFLDRSVIFKENDLHGNLPLYKKCPFSKSVYSYSAREQFNTNNIYSRI